MGIKAYESIKAGLLTMWNGISEQTPSSLKDAVNAGIAKITDALEVAQLKITALTSDKDYSDEYKQRRIAEIKQSNTEVYTAEVDKLNQALQEEVEKLQGILAIPKPKELDHGELLNLKADLKMLLDSLDNRTAKTRLSQELEKAIEKGDEIKAWLLGASNWPALYMESRGVSPEEWEAAKETALVNKQTQEQAEARQLLKLLTNKQKGVAAAINSIRFYAKACAGQLL